jgi:hypothetical protein
MTETNRGRNVKNKSMSPKSSRLSRREFLGNVAVGMGGLLCPLLARAESLMTKASGNSRVVIARDPAVIAGGKVNAEVAEKLVHRAVCLLTGKDDQSLAWKSLFSPKERVIIKVNARHPPVAGNREIADAIVNGLKAASVDENRILIYDFLDKELVRCRYTLNDSAKGVRCYANRDYTEVKAGPVSVRLSKIVTDQADAIINVPALRHHGLAGVTVSMKNHLGSVQNPRDLHLDSCLYVADLNALDPIRKKTRLIIADGILAQYDGGPSYRPQFAWEYGGVIAATDTVAVDAVGAEEILAERHRRGMEGPIRPTARHVDRAAEIGLGIADPKRIDLVRWPA